MTNFENVDNNTEEISVDDIPLSFIEKQIYSRQHYGLSADELEAIFPDLVYENEDYLEELGEETVEILYPGIDNFSELYNEFAYRNLDADTLAYLTTLWETLKIA